jgi:hypothetical protein
MTYTLRCYFNYMSYKAFIQLVVYVIHWSCGICGGQSGAVAGFLRVLRFPLPFFIPPIAPQSSSSIIWGLHNRPEVAAVPSGLSPTPLIIIIICYPLKLCHLLSQKTFKNYIKRSQCRVHLKSLHGVGTMFIPCSNTSDGRNVMKIGLKTGAPSVHYTPAV